MGMQIKVGGRMVTAKFGDALEKMTRSSLSKLQQQITMTGNAEGERFAHDLLELAKQKAPLSTFREGQSLGLDRKGFSAGEKNMAKTVGANLITYKGKGMRIQMKDSKGRFSKQREVYLKPAGYSMIKHSPGALRDSGRVESRGSGNKKRFVVSFDTRRTDPYSMMKNFNYAVKQHNDTRMHHTHGESGYLLKAVLELKNKYFTNLSQVIKKEVRSRGLWGWGE